MKHTKSYIPNHPRPDFSRKDFESLDGIWKFKFDNDNRGIKENWFNGFESSLEIKVPYAYQSPKSGIVNHDPCDVVWYEKNVFIKNIENKLPILHLEGSDYITDIYINGQHLKHDIGGYHQISTDLSAFVNQNVKIVIRVEDKLDATYARGKQRWKTPSYECFYVETSGLYKPVWIEYVGSTYIQSVKLTSDIDQFLLSSAYVINGDLEDISLRVDISFSDVLISSTTHIISRNHFHASYPLLTDDQTMKLYLWSPDHPHLYDLKLTILKGSVMIDEVMTYFGVRKFNTQGRQIILNHVPIYLKMILDQGYFHDDHLTATEENIKNDVELMKSIGLNVVRKHEKIEDHRFHYYCDILGLLTWVEMPSFYEFNDTSTQQMLNEWQTIIKEHYNYPSVMAWVGLNESWGVPGIIHDKRKQAFADAMVYVAKSIDQTRFVISNDGWEHTNSDLITLHNYRETYDELYTAYKDILGVLNRDADHKLLPKFPLADGYDYKNQPIILSEFAGIALSKDKDLGWGYGETVSDSDALLIKLEKQIDAILAIPDISGYCITQLTDVQQEVNGLFDETRHPKVSLKELKKIISKS